MEHHRIVPKELKGDIKKKENRQPEKSLPMPVILLMAMVPMLLFAYLFLSVITEKVPRYQQPQPSYGYEPSTQEKQFRKKGDAAFTSLTRNTQDQVERMKTEQKLQKHPATFD